MRNCTTPPPGGRGSRNRVLILHFSQVVPDTATGAFVAECSDLGLPPGAPPPAVIVLVTPRTLKLFRLVSEDRAGGEVAGWRYKGAGPGLLLVND